MRAMNSSLATTPKPQDNVHTLQIPQAALHSSDVADTWFA